MLFLHKFQTKSNALSRTQTPTLPPSSLCLEMALSSLRLFQHLHNEPLHLHFPIFSTSFVEQTCETAIPLDGWQETMMSQMWGKGKAEKNWLRTQASWRTTSLDAAKWQRSFWISSGFKSFNLCVFLECVCIYKDSRSLAPQTHLYYWLGFVSTHSTLLRPNIISLSVRHFKFSMELNG